MFRGEDDGEVLAVNELGQSVGYVLMHGFKVLKYRHTRIAQSVEQQC